MSSLLEVDQLRVHFPLAVGGLLQLRRDLGMAIVLITHDLGVVAGLSDRVMVMYAGRIVEEGRVDAMFEAPQHPYTLGLLGSTPSLEEQTPALRTIPGQPPNLQALPPGCSFNDRCRFAFERCIEERPRLRGFAPGRSKACHLERLA